MSIHQWHICPKEYPCICQIHTKEEIDHFLKNHKNYIYSVFEEITKLKNENIELKKAVQLQEYTTQGEHSMYKGELNEKRMEILLKDTFPLYDIDNIINYLIMIILLPQK